MAGPFGPSSPLARFLMRRSGFAGTPPAATALDLQALDRSVPPETWPGAMASGFFFGTSAAPPSCCAGRLKCTPLPQAVPSAPFLDPARHVPPWRAFSCRARPGHYGYARVSTNRQDYDLQVEQLKAAGCERIFAEKVSGKSTDGRREFQRLMKALNPGDTVVVTKLDRLARSSRDPLNILPSLKMAPAASYRSGRPGATPRPTSASWLSPSCPASPSSSAS